MASVVTRANGTREVRFWIRKGERKTFYLGKVPKKSAESIGKRLDDLAFRVRHNQSPDVDLSAWLLALDAPDYAKLVAWGLVEPKEPAAPPVELMTVGKWIDTFIAKGKRKPATIEQLTIAGANMRTFLGDDKPLVDVTCGDAEDYRVWLETKARDVPEGEDAKGLALNTVRRRIGRAKQFFNAAVRHRLLSENPFANEASAVGANVERQVFIPADWIERCIKAAPCEDWRIIIAFARYAGMRSHETRLQRWEDIDIPNARMIVRSTKTPPTRVCPIFPELMPHIRRAREMAPSGAEFVQTRYTPEANIGTTFTKIVERAGLVPWDKLFQNMRATRETELMAVYPVKDVSSWLGNSAPVAMKHYAMTMQDSFTRATREGACVAVVKTHQNPHQSEAVTPILDDSHQNPHQQTELENIAKHVICGLLTVADNLSGCPTRTVTRSGIAGDFERGDGFTPESTPATARLFSLWHSLDDATREGLRSYAATITDNAS
jgi:integrase